MDASWVQEHTLPKDIVAEYEHGTQTEVAVHQKEQCGPLYSTAYVDKVQEDTAECPSKKAKMMEWSAETSG